MLYLNFYLAPLTWSIAFAVNWPGPAATQNPGVGHGFSPVPTAEPQALLKAHLFEAHWKRQITSAATTSTSQGPICGYVDGSTNNWYSCPVFCAVATSYSAWGCCRSTECNLSTACIDQPSLASCAQNPSCAADQYLAKCGGISSLCNEFVISGAANVPLTHYQCDTTPNTLIMLATATDGSKSAAVYTSVSMSIPSKTSTTSTTTSTALPGPSTITTTVSPSTTTSPVTTTTSSSPSPTPTPPSKPPVGAIVGGVVGGLAVLAAIIIGILWARRRKQPANVVAPSGYQPPPVEMGYSGPPTGGYGQAPPPEKHIYHQAQISPITPGSSQFAQTSPRPGPNQHYSAELDSNMGSPTPQYAAYSPPPPTNTYPGVSEVDGSGMPPRGPHGY